MSYSPGFPAAESAKQQCNLRDELQNGADAADNPVAEYTCQRGVTVMTGDLAVQQDEPLVDQIL